MSTVEGEHRFSGKVVGGTIANPKLASSGRGVWGKEGGEPASQCIFWCTLEVMLWCDGGPNSFFPPTAQLLVVGASSWQQEVSYFSWHCNWRKWWSGLQLHLHSRSCISSPNVRVSEVSPTAFSVLRPWKMTQKFCVLHFWLTTFLFHNCGCSGHLGK